jgi:hypothetical protein
VPRRFWSACGPSFDVLSTCGIRFAPCGTWSLLLVTYTHASTNAEPNIGVRLLLPRAARGRTQKYPYYHCTRRGHTRVAASELDTQFLSYVQSLQPDPDYSDLLQQLLVDTLHTRTEHAAKQRRVLESQLLTCEANLGKLKDRYLYASTPLPDEIWREASERLNAEKRSVETVLASLDSRQSTDGEALILFAGRVFGQAAEIWRRASPEQRERLQLAYFPERLSYGEGDFRTARMCVFFNDLSTDSMKIGGMASPRRPNRLYLAGPLSA